jgi:hypothetical protein
MRRSMASGYAPPHSEVAGATRDFARPGGGVPCLSLGEAQRSSAEAQRSRTR